MLELLTRPITGPQYLESLRDGREVYLYEERVRDVVTHPAFRTAARSICAFLRCPSQLAAQKSLLATDLQEQLLTFDRRGVRNPKMEIPFR